MNVGIIGAGNQAKNVHLPTLKSINGVKVMGIADINEKRVRYISDKFNIQNTYTDYIDMLGNEDIDLILISAPHQMHKKMTIDCAKAGKHILVEKPMATTVRDADEMINAAKDNNVKLCVVQNYRFFPSVLDSRERIENGRIGQINSIGAHMFDFPPPAISEWRFDNKEYAGVIEEIGPHLIDIVLYLNNSEIHKISAIGGNFGESMSFIDHALITITFKDKSVATLDLSWLTGAKEFSLYIQGTGGLLHTDVRNNHVQEIHQYWTPIDEAHDILRKVSGTVKGIMSGEYFIGPKKFHREIIINFIDSIKNDTRPPISGEEGRKIAMVIETALKSIREN